jgi:mRNA interferase MazF
MPTTIVYEFGDVVLVPFPFTDQTASKKRPAIVVSSTAYQRARADVIVMAVTSQLKPSDVPGEVVVTHWQHAGLLKPSVVKPVITTLHKRLIIRKLGRLPRCRATRVARRVSPNRAHDRGPWAGGWPTPPRRRAPRPARGAAERLPGGRPAARTP